MLPPPDGDIGEEEEQEGDDDVRPEFDELRGFGRGEVGELVIGFDTSGSCFGSDEMTLFASHVAAIVEQVRPAKVHVAYVDTSVAGFQTFEDGQFAVANMKPEGGGGTHLPVLWDYLARNRIDPVACVFLTDGETDFGTPPNFPVLWAMTTDTTAPYGTNVRIEQ